MTPWEIKARELANCNCSYGCPCQFNALPTHGFCEAVICMQIDKGFYGSVDISGVKFSCIVQWPGPVHEGHGKCQLIIDSDTSEAQRNAVIKITSGEDTQPGKTIFNVFAATYDLVYEPIFAPIKFEVDIDARTGSANVAGLIEMRGEPILNPVTGAEHRVRIDIPDGFEYSIAEIGSCSSKTSGQIVLDLNSTYGQFAHIHLSNNGVVRA